ncbi:LSM domain-containing protein [Phthorimaea operculella]|nr:LSM domain-containing protein [Phthorimaea operculella]
MSRKEALSSFIQNIHGRPVVVKLNSGVDYRGVLACLDGYMNIALEQTEEYVNGQLKNKYGDAFIRGNNISGSGTPTFRVRGRWDSLSSPSICVGVPLTLSVPNREKG